MERAAEGNTNSARLLELVCRLKGVGMSTGPLLSQLFPWLFLGGLLWEVYSVSNHLETVHSPAIFSAKIQGI